MLQVAQCNLMNALDTRQLTHCALCGVSPSCVPAAVAGAGKTTIILKLLQQLQAAEHKTSNNSAANDNKNNTAAAGSIVWLKNEFGNVAVDSVLAQQSNIAAVQEILNGCICCTAVGKLSEAITEVVTEFHPARIFVETSGSAFPAPIAMEVHFRANYIAHLCVLC